MFAQIFHHLITKQITISKWQFNLALFIAFAFGIIFSLSYLTNSYLLPKLFAATSPWSQTDWSGGEGSSTANQYSASSNIGTSPPGQFSLATPTSISNPDFETDLSSWYGGVLPNSLSDLKLWLKADALTSINDGETVTTWSDSSGNGYDLTQSNSSYKPLYKTNILNSMPGIRFDGSNDSLQNTAFVNSAALTGDPPLSVFMVFKRNNSKGSLSFTGSNAGGLWADSYDYNAGSVSSASLAGYKIYVYTKSPGTINPNGKIYKNGSLSVSGYTNNPTPNIPAGNVFFLRWMVCPK